ncbi:MAG: septum formation initiator family protein [Ferruginibacter sp.]
MLKYIPSILKNKYLLSGGAFIIWMFFFDPKDIPSSLQRREKLNELQKNEQHSTNLIKESRKNDDLLKTNAETIETFARENYHMKKDNEDLFIVNTTKKTR